MRMHRYDFIDKILNFKVLYVYLIYVFQFFPGGPQIFFNAVAFYFSTF
jgi:hypothetical protein